MVGVGCVPSKGMRLGGMLLLNSKVRAARSCRRGGSRNAGCLISDRFCLLLYTRALGFCSWQGATEKDQNTGSPRARPRGGPGPGEEEPALGCTGARDWLGQHSCCGGHRGGRWWFWGDASSAVAPGAAPAKWGQSWHVAGGAPGAVVRGRRGERGRGRGDPAGLGVHRSCSSPPPAALAEGGAPLRASLPTGRRRSCA